MPLVPFTVHLSPDFYEMELSIWDFLLPIMYPPSTITVLQCAWQQHSGSWVSCSYGSSNTLQVWTAECIWHTVSCPIQQNATSLSSHSGSLAGHVHSWCLSSLFTSFPAHFTLWTDIPSVREFFAPLSICQFTSFLLSSYSKWKA